MENNNYKKTERVYVGDKDGVTVIPDKENNRYIVELPNSYDVYWGFTGSKDGVDFAQKLESTDPKKVVYAVSVDNLLDESKIRNFNIKVNEARRTNRDILTEKSELEGVLSFDHTKEGKTVAFLYKNPAKGFCVGEILMAGKYFVAQSGGESEDKVFIRIVHTNRLLSGKEEFAEREETIKAKFPVGQMKYMRFDDHGRIVSRDYQPKAVQEKTEQVEATKEATKVAQEAVKEAVEALAPVKEKAPRKVKSKVATAT
jgi:hypothetical protein